MNTLDINSIVYKTNLISTIVDFVLPSLWA